MTYLSGALAASDEVNKEQLRYWTSEGLQQYEQHGDRFEAMVAPFGHAVLDAARLQTGDRVLDVGCGFATTTIDAARQVTSTGRVVGVDISPGMLRTARRRVAAAGLEQVALLEADAQIHPFDSAAFDAVISRFGTMFFQDPQAAFANLARAVRPDGRLSFVCWQDPRKSEWIATALGAVVALLGRRPELGSPGAPGPWAFADGDRLERLLIAGGFRDVCLEPLTRPQRIGDDVNDAARFVLSLPESQQLFTGASQETVAAAAAAIEAAFAPHASAAGVVLDASAWLITARR